MSVRAMALMGALYLAAFAVVVWLTGARGRRIAGAAVGGAMAACVVLSAAAGGETRGWWRIPAGGGPFWWTLMWTVAAVSCAPIYLVTWRVARRFGGRGLAACILAAAVVGPPRDYAIAAAFPDWIVFSPGLTPVVADAAVYALLLASGHAVMRITAGPSRDQPTTASARCGW
jgi:hypothetical protein